MYYEFHGAGPPLLLLHGAYMTIDTMGPILPGLAESREVIAVELQGHGHTADIDRPITYEQMADDAVALLVHLGVERRRRCRLQHGRWRRPASGDPSSGCGPQTRGCLGVVSPRWHALGRLADVPVDIPGALCRVADRGRPLDAKVLTDFRDPGQSFAHLVSTDGFVPPPPERPGLRSGAPSRRLVARLHAALGERYGVLGKGRTRTGPVGVEARLRPRDIAHPSLARNVPGGQSGTCRRERGTELSRGEIGLGSRERCALDDGL